MLSVILDLLIEDDNTEENNDFSEEDENLSSEDEKSLSQEEIDNLLGLGDKESTEDQDSKKSAIDKFLDESLMSFERFPMLEVIFDRFARFLSGSYRNFTSDNVDVDVTSITSVRFKDYLSTLPIPSIIVIFRAAEWEGYGLISINSSLVYSMIDILFGGKKSNRPIKIEGRPYTAIEKKLARVISEIMLNDLGLAFDHLTQATFKFERIENNPKFAMIANNSDVAIILKSRVDMDEYGGTIDVVVPLATIEPIKNLLSQSLGGKKITGDAVWYGDLSKQIYRSLVELEVVLGRKSVHLKDIANLKVGQTIILDAVPDENVMVKCQGVDILTGKVGRVANNIAIIVDEVLKRKE